MSASYGNFVEQYACFNQVGAIFHTATYQCLKHDREIKESDLPKLSGRYVERLSTHFRHMMAVSAIDNFNSFLSELVVEILEKDPRPISGKNFPVKEIMAHNDIDELKKRVVEKYVTELGYQNIDDLVKFLEDNFGIYSLSSWLTRLRLRRSIQIRNVITHNRGIVNKTYLFRSQSKRDVEGDLVWTRHPVRMAGYIKFLVDRLDQEATEKFDLQESVPRLPIGIDDLA